VASEHTAVRWDDIYQRTGGLTNSWYTAEPAYALRLLADLDVGVGAAVLDVGGGAGNLVDGLLAAGFTDLTVLDLSATALDIARRRLGPAGDRVTWVAHDVLTWSAPRAYDVWHDRALLHFLLDDADRQGYLAVLRAATRAGSHVVLATFAADGPTSCSGSPVRRHDAADLIAFLGPDFAPVCTAREIHVTPAGDEQPFTWAVFTRMR
jgi:SAM-dependent methyltransferase